MMNEKINTVIEYLSSSIANNEVTNVEKLTIAINELEYFPMTFEILDSSRVGQILQSIRHSKEISMFIKERIRSLIKCWRQLLNDDTFSVIPFEIKSKTGKTPAVRNGYTNGYIQNEAQFNGVDSTKSTDKEPIKDNSNSVVSISDNNRSQIAEHIVSNVTGGLSTNIISKNTTEVNIEKITIDDPIQVDYTDSISINKSKIEGPVEPNVTNIASIESIIGLEVVTRISIDNTIEGPAGEEVEQSVSVNENNKSYNEAKFSEDASANDDHSNIIEEHLEVEVTEKYDEPLKSDFIISVSKTSNIASSISESNEILVTNDVSVNSSDESRIGLEKTDDVSINVNDESMEMNNTNDNYMDKSKDTENITMTEPKVSEEESKTNESVEEHFTVCVSTKSNISDSIEQSVAKNITDSVVVVADSNCNMKSPVLKINIDRETKVYTISENEAPDRSRNVSSSSKVTESLPVPNESQSIQISQIGKPKLKSTKELLADFSNFIESDIKNKILMDKISQEDDEPISYFPNDSKVKELVQMSLLQEKYNNKTRQHTMKRRRTVSIQSSDPEEVVIPTKSKCAMLLQQFNEICTIRPQVVLKHFVPWPNLKRGLQIHPPEIKQPLSKRRRLQSLQQTETPKPVADPLSLNVIDNLLESFETRAQQKQMISDAIQQRKEQTKIVDNTLSLMDMSLKLKLKIPKVPTIKIRRKKKTRKKKKPKVKPIKVRVKKPRKPYIRPMPPITNYLDDIPLLPPLGEYSGVIESAEEVSRAIIEYNEENITKLVYGVMEGYNCTRRRSSEGSELVGLTSMYSHIISQQYLHVFPWVDLVYSTKPSFPDDCNELLQSIIDIQSFCS